MVDWAREYDDKARIDAIRTRKRAEKTVEDAIVMIRDGERSAASVGREQRA